MFLFAPGECDGRKRQHSLRAQSQDSYAAHKHCHCDTQVLNNCQIQRHTHRPWWLDTGERTSFQIILEQVNKYWIHLSWSHSFIFSTTKFGDFIESKKLVLPGGICWNFSSSFSILLPCPNINAISIFLLQLLCWHIFFVYLHLQYDLIDGRKLCAVCNTKKSFICKSLQSKSMYNLQFVTKIVFSHYMDKYKISVLQYIWQIQLHTFTALHPTEH